ncbi:AAA family ATPase [Lederbergia citrea]|nr:AAA family ATPase [Lederbergia citrea]
MAIVCTSCGEYIVPTVNKEKHTATCLNCNHESAMNIFPLFIVTGASGVGKTTVVTELRKYLPDYDIFETDIIEDNDWQTQRNNWLRIAHSIAQNNRKTILCGTMMPEDVAKCDHFGFFSQVHYAILHCDDQTREARLRARPAWRNCGSDEFIADHKKFAHWLVENANTAFVPPAPIIDTTFNNPNEVARDISNWVQSC